LRSKLVNPPDAAPTAPSYGALTNPKGGDVAVAVMVENPEGSQATYEAVRLRLGPHRPEGGIFHIAGPGPNGGWRVIEVWESEEQADTFFREHLVPALRATGVPPPKERELWPIHAAMR
jgi:hypothetical protein